MRDNDGRKLDRKALELLRIRAVEQMLAGVRPDDVAAALGFSRAAVYGWLASYRAAGRQALLARPAHGRPPRISAVQLAELWTLLVSTDPRDRHFGLALWTRGLVRELIRREFGVDLSLVTVGRLMAKMGLTPDWPQRPDRRRAPLRGSWWAEEYPAIRARARAGDAVVYFVGRKTIPSLAQRFHDAGIQVPANDSAQESQVTMMFALSTKEELRFALYGDPPAATLPGFCERLMHDVVGIVYLIVDGCLAYSESAGAPLANRVSARLRVFYLVEHAREDSVAVAGRAVREPGFRRPRPNAPRLPAGPLCRPRHHDPSRGHPPARRGRPGHRTAVRALAPKPGEANRTGRATAPIPIFKGWPEPKELSLPVSTLAKWQPM
ncbi:MAG TPA: helix-turn-helix domain-containing protein [Streptosporangiaceae bacterium]|nr:helix-turn-helix domain-containing protein [Streptosporangiaceae bacterium]